jgi:hypothetical protein
LRERETYDADGDGIVGVFLGRRAASRTAILAETR